MIVMKNLNNDSQKAMMAREETPRRRTEKYGNKERNRRLFTSEGLRFRIKRKARGIIFKESDRMTELSLK